MKIRPLLDKIVIEELSEDTVTTGGIVLPTSKDEKPNLARIVAIGGGGFIDGHEVIMQVAVGAKVLFSAYAGIDFKFENKKYKILKQSDVLAIIEGE